MAQGKHPGSEITAGARAIIGQLGRALGSLLDLHGLDLEDDHLSAPPGAAPGIDTSHGVNTPPEPGEVLIRWYEYNSDGVEEQVDVSLERMLAAPAPADGVTRWIDVVGVHPHVISRLQRVYKFHTLAAEDALHTTQRPRVDRYDSQVVVFVRMLRLVDDSLLSEQVSLFLCGSTLISFQEEPGDVWGLVRDRIRTVGTRVRTSGADFLLYVLLDAVVDHCVPVLDRYGEVLDGLDARPTKCVGVLEHPDGVGEGLQVQLQVAAVRAPADQRGELVGVLAGQCRVPVLVGQLHDGGRAETAVEVVVQQHLRGRHDVVLVQLHRRSLQTNAHLRTGSLSR